MQLLGDQAKSMKLESVRCESNEMRCLLGNQEVTGGSFQYIGPGTSNDTLP